MKDLNGFYELKYHEIERTHLIVSFLSDRVNLGKRMGQRELREGFEIKISGKSRLANKVQGILLGWADGKAGCVCGVQMTPSNSSFPLCAAPHHHNHHHNHHDQDHHHEFPQMFMVSYI